eukprot:scaffold10754_cov62-Phaeocystis_antarctica.AAC.2
MRLRPQPCDLCCLHLRLRLGPRLRRQPLRLLRAALLRPAYLYRHRPHRRLLCRHPDQRRRPQHPCRHRLRPCPRLRYRLRPRLRLRLAEQTRLLRRRLDRRLLCRLVVQAREHLRVDQGHERVLLEQRQEPQLLARG